MTKKLTKEETGIFSMLLWLWLAEHPERSLEGWPGWKKEPVARWVKEIPVLARTGSFLCAYDDQNSAADCLEAACTNCLVKWGGSAPAYDLYEPCACPSSPYRRWLEAKTQEDRKKAAEETLGLILSCFGKTLTTKEKESKK